MSWTDRSLLVLTMSYAHKRPFLDIFQKMHRDLNACCPINLSGKFLILVPIRNTVRSWRLSENRNIKVSTFEQNLGFRIDRLLAHGWEKIYEERRSGGVRERPVRNERLFAIG